jgi:hypothetical protein
VFNTYELIYYVYYRIHLKIGKLRQHTYQRYIGTPTWLLLPVLQKIVKGVS